MSQFSLAGKVLNEKKCLQLYLITLEIGQIENTFNILSLTKFETLYC